MTTTKTFVAVGAVMALLTGFAPQAADAFNGKFGVRVAQVNDAVFEVVPRSSGSGPVFWCGAADYARQVLGAGWKTTIYIARGRGQSVTTNRRSAVQFTLDPSTAGITPIEQSLSLNSLKVGDNMSVQQANQYCTMPPSRF